MRVLYVLLVAMAVVTGCAPYVQSVSRSATAGAVDGLTSPEATWKLDGLSAEAAAAGVAGAREEAFGPATMAEVRALVASLGASLREQLVLTRDGLLDETLRAEIAKLRLELLGPETRKLVLALAEEVREELLGAPLRADVDALLVDATPKIADLVTKAVQAALAPVKADASAEAEKYKTVAIGLGVSALALTAALGATVYLVLSHRKLLAALLERGIAPARG